VYLPPLCGTNNQGAASFIYETASYHRLLKTIHLNTGLRYIAARWLPD